MRIHERIRVETNSLTFLLLFPNLFKLCIGILHGLRSRPHTRWDLRLCFSRLTFESSVDIAYFSMRFHSSMFANSNAACMFSTRFERIIHSISTDLAGHKHLFFFPYTMQGAHQSERRACVKVKTSCMRVKDLSANCDWTKKKKKGRRYFNFHFAKLWNDLWFCSSPSKFSSLRKTTLWLWERHFRLFHRSLW